MTTRDPRQDSPLRLITIPFSHYCEKARWALDRFGVPYREEAHIPFAHIAAAARYGRRTVPILVSPAGNFADSTDILVHLDTYAPAGARLFPTDEAVRRDVETLEERFDLAVGPAARRWAYGFLLPDRARMLSLFTTGLGAAGKFAVRATLPLMIPIMRSSMKVTPAACARSKAKLDEVFTEVEARLSDGRRFLAGDALTAADITFASLAAPALAPPEYGGPLPPLDALPPAMIEGVRQFRERPAGAFALRLYREERRTVLSASASAPVCPSVA